MGAGTRRRAIAAPTLTRRALNRALLQRQLLLARSSLSLEDAVEQVGGLQTQYAPSGYVGLWTRLAGFRRPDLTKALEDRRLVQATLMRTTIHLVSRREYWLYALGVRQARRDWAVRSRLASEVASRQEGAARLADALASGAKDVRELGAVASGFLGDHSLWVDLVRVPPSGTWERRRADRLALATEWVGPEDATEEEGRAHLVRAHLRGFGPAAWRDIASWAGLSVTSVRDAGANLALTRYADADGRELVDLAGLEIPDEDTPAPVRFLPHFDANLLVHARRTGILPEEHRPRVFSIKNPFSVGTILVDGRVVGWWMYRDGRIVAELLEKVARRDLDAIEEERAALEAFHA